MLFKKKARSYTAKFYIAYSFITESGHTGFGSFNSVMMVERGFKPTENTLNDWCKWVIENSKKIDNLAIEKVIIQNIIELGI